MAGEKIGIFYVGVIIQPRAEHLKGRATLSFYSEFEFFTVVRKKSNWHVAPSCVSVLIPSPKTLDGLAPLAAGIIPHVLVGSAMRGRPSEPNRMASLLEKHAMGILVGSIMATLLFMTQLVPLPEFSTEVSDFAPPNDADGEIEAIESEFPPQASRIYVNVKSSELGGNPLTVPSMQELIIESAAILSIAEEHGVTILSQINVALAVDTMIKEREQGSGLSEMAMWGQIIDAIEQGEDCTSIAGETSITAAAGFAAEVLVSSDLQFEGLCDYLDGGDGVDPTPSASSTMWIIESSSQSSEEALSAFSSAVRDYLSSGGSNEADLLQYSVVSEELVSQDINDGTLSNFTTLLAISLLVIVGILAMAFRSVVMVAAPLVALTAALSWTYGIVALFGSEFTVLDIAVAPVILGLGIDYGIHMQKGYERKLSEGMRPSLAWTSSFDVLRLALSLSVITTVTAFLSNALSPIDPLRAFGTTLAIGVVCAFIATTVTVGAIHVISERSTGKSTQKSVKSREITKKASIFMDNGLAKVMVVVAILTLSSTLVSIGRLETSFELTDFLDKDMESMEARNEIYSDYDVQFLKTAIILIDYNDPDAAPDDRTIMESMLGLHSRLVLDPNVIRPQNTENSRPQYEGIYTVLRDRLEIDPDWGSDYGIQIFDGEVGLSSDHEQGDLALALAKLAEDTTLGDPLRGQTWADRAAKVVAFDEASGAIRYLMIDVSVTAESSEDTDSIADDFKKHANWMKTDGKCGCTTYLTGEVIVIESVLDGLFVSQLESTLLSLLASFVVLMMMTRRFSTSAVIILPVAIAGIWVVGTMALVGLNWNVLTVMITALTIGLGIDYSIHMWRRFEEELEGGSDRIKAMTTAYEVTGSALAMSAFTTASGFLVLLMSPVPVIQDFGFVSASSVALSLVLALFVLPALLLSEAKARGIR